MDQHDEDQHNRTEVDTAATAALSLRAARLMLARSQVGLPQDVRSKTRMHIADAIGIAVAAAKTTDLARQAIAAAAAGQASGRCSVIGQDIKLPPTSAAFANSALIHILDFDDIHDIARLHPTSVTLPAALAAAELSAAPNHRIVDGVALGNEMMCRLGSIWLPSGTGPVSDWFTTQLFGYVGGCVAAAIVMGFDEEQLASALGLAYMQAAGGKEAGFGVGATARAIYPAFAAMGGVHACLLAREGIVGPPRALDGSAGLFRILFGTQADANQISTLLDPDAWLFRATEIKPWPSCRLSHPYIAAAQALRRRLVLEPQGTSTPARIDISVNASAAKLCNPLAQRRRPQTLQDGKYSIPFMTAFALTRDQLDLDTIRDSMLEDATAQSWADLIEIHETLPDRPGHPPVEIVLTLNDGRTLEYRNEWQSTMGEDAVRQKFMACLAHANVKAGAAAWESINRERTSEPGLSSALAAVRA